MTTTPLDERFRFRSDASVSIDDGVVEITVMVFAYRFDSRIDSMSPGVLEAIRRLVDGPMSETELADAVTAIDGDLGVIGWKKILIRFLRMGIMARSLWSNSVEVIEMVPDAFPMMSDSVDVHPSSVVSLSRFAAIHVVDGSLEMQTPRSGWRVRLLDPQIAAFVASLAVPRSVADHSGTAAVDAGLDAEQLSLVITMLARAGMLVTHADVDAMSSEGIHPSLRLWSFHDLLFHERTRVGRTRRPFGGTYPFVGTDIEPIAFQRESADNAIQLATPSADPADGRAAAFFDVLEGRRSLREYDDENPITLDELTELLWRSAHVRSIEPNDYGDIVDRPFPAGGGMHELDIYIAVRLVAGLAPGLYRFDGVRNQLVPVAEGSPTFWNWFHMVPAWPEPDTLPQAMLVLSARFARVMWKYESMAYALILKDAGVILQTLSLATEALGLGGCALGAGDAEGFAQLAGLDPYAETSVGEFALGRPVPSPPRISEEKG